MVALNATNEVNGIASIDGMEQIYRRLSGNLKRLLRAKNYTAERLAYESGIDKGNLSRVIAGKQGASMDLMQKVADTLEIDVEELFKKE